MAILNKQFNSSSYFEINSLTQIETDSININSFSALEYLVTVAGALKSLTFKIILNKTDESFDWQIFAINGCLDIDLTFSKVDQKLIMLVMNNESELIKFKLIRKII